MLKKFRPNRPATPNNPLRDLTKRRSGVRRPKYAGDLFLVFGVPLALGSWWSLALVVLTIPGLVWRIFDEEKLLKKDLPGYVEYTQMVRYRLVPYLW